MNNAFRVPLRAQGGMPEYRSQSIGPQAGANVSARYDDRAAGIMLAQANRNAQADAQGWEQFDRGLQGFLKAGVGLYNDYRDKTSRAYIQEAVLRSQEEFAAWQAEYDKTHQGEQGINAAADYEQAWARISATHMKGLRDKGVSGPYEQYADLQFRQNGLHYGRQGVAFQTQQDKRWKGSLADGAYAALENTVAANPDDHERIGAMKAQAYQAYALAHPGEDMRAFEDKVNNLVANTSIEARIAAGDFEGAQRDLAVYGNAGGVNNGHSIAEDHNNPLNEKAPGKNTGTREDFKVYASIEDGLRGNWGLLQRYQSRHNRRTLREIITRWAPPSENRTAQYIANVSQKAGIDADAPVNMRDIPTAARVIKAMAEQESPLGQRLTVPQIEAALKGENAKRPAMYVAYDNPEGLTEQGNIDIANRPQVRTPDGGTATVRSMSVNFDGAEVLLPTVSQDGRLLSEDEAIAEYRKTGKHLGKFDTPEHASAYAQKLHEQQEKMYLGPAARQQPGRAGAGWLTPRQQAEYEQSIRTGMERQQKEDDARAILEMVSAASGLPQEQRLSSVYDEIDKVRDPERRDRLRTLAAQELEFQKQRETAQTAMQGRALAAQVGKEAASPADMQARLLASRQPQAVIDYAQKLLFTDNKENPANRQALREALLRVDSGELPTAQDREIWGYRHGMTNEQTKKLVEYRGREAETSISDVQRVYDRLYKINRIRAEKMPGGFYEAVLQRLPRGQKPTDRDLESIVANLAMDGEFEGGVFSLGYGPDRTAFEALGDTERGPTWLPKLQEHEIPELDALLLRHHIAVTDFNRRKLKKLNAGIPDNRPWETLAPSNEEDEEAYSGEEY